MSANRVECRKGDPCSFSAKVSTGIDGRYTRAKFQVRENWDETLPLLLGVDETSGIEIDHDTDTVTVVIGATQTDTLGANRQPREAAAQLRLYNAADADDRVSYLIPFVLLPEIITDA